MGRLPFDLLIFSSILLIQCQANALDNTTKNGLDPNRERGKYLVQVSANMFNSRM
ncbi:uncharacterized protein LOC122621500 isoform X2 [Drosophila teissieri]|uniref:uncharacterized protein LOC122621500 isoform X2 n=1 Tax=Drosophila teissieri TaxID=7243 RepID=UPI001CB9E49C|nr:uncharacterized protein LOC122621500 isoform X2 [Drosophila teissieri]